MRFVGSTHDEYYDIGASFGSLTLAEGRRTAGGYRIVAIEPSLSKSM